MIRFVSGFIEHFQEFVVVFEHFFVLIKSGFQVCFEWTDKSRKTVTWRFRHLVRAVYFKNFIVVWFVLCRWWTILNFAFNLLQVTPCNSQKCGVWPRPASHQKLQSFFFVIADTITVAWTTAPYYWLTLNCSLFRFLNYFLGFSNEKLLRRIAWLPDLELLGLRGLHLEITK